MTNDVAVPSSKTTRRVIMPTRIVIGQIATPVRIEVGRCHAAHDEPGHGEPDEEWCGGLEYPDDAGLLVVVPAPDGDEQDDDEHVQPDGDGEATVVLHGSSLPVLSVDPVRCRRRAGRCPRTSPIARSRRTGTRSS